MIGHSTHAGIATGRFVRFARTPAGGIATLGRADVAIVAVARFGGHADAAHAAVFFGAFVAVATSGAVGGLLAAARLVAGVVGARVAIVTDLRLAWLAAAVVAGVRDRAHVFVGTTGLGGEMQATGLVRTSVIGTDVVVVAVGERPRQADAFAAVVAERTTVAIATRRCVVDEGATLDGVAAVVRTWIAVGAWQLQQRHAGAAGADVTDRADVAIAADELIVGVLAAALWHATIGCAGVVVVATCCLPRLTDGAGTTVIERAEVAVVTRHRIASEHTATHIIATVIGARVVVVTTRHSPRFAHARLTGIVDRASLAVVAGATAGGRSATHRGIAGIGRARVVIVANRGRTWQAGGRFANVALRTHVPVSASRRVDCVGATLLGNTGIVGAGV